MGSIESERVISGSSVVVSAKDHISADLDDEAVILEVKSGTYYGLDVVGARIWSLVQEPITVDDVRDALLQDFEVDPERCERELRAFLWELAAHGLVDVS